MIRAETLQFLYELSQNNNRDWFEKNKGRYEKDVKKPFEETVAAILAGLKDLEPTWSLTPKECIFRLHRDTRFSADKSPYKTNLAASFNPKSRRELGDPGYYLHLEFGQLMLGGGAYFVEKDPLTRIRKAIAADTAHFRRLVDDPDFVQKFGSLRGETNKVMPAEFREAAKTEPLLLHKQFYYMAELDPETTLRPDFVPFVLDHFRAAKPLTDFFRQAITASTSPG